MKDINDDKNRFNIIMLLFVWSVAVEHCQTLYLSLAAKFYRINPRRCKVITHGVWRKNYSGVVDFSYILHCFQKKLRTPSIFNANTENI